MQDHIKTMVLLIASSITFCSCASIKGNIPFQYQPSLVQGQVIESHAGVAVLNDCRPEYERQDTEGIADIDEKITAKIIDDLATSKIFKDIHFGTQDGDTVTISGDINHFTWKMIPTGLAFIPFLIYTGAPVYHVSSVSDITLRVADKTTGMTKTFNGRSQLEDTYSMYRFKEGEPGSELAEAFRDSIKIIKNEMIAGGGTVLRSTVPVATSHLQSYGKYAREKGNFALYVFASNPLYSVSYVTVDQTISPNQMTYHAEGVNSESAPTAVGGAGIRTALAKRFYVGIKMTSAFSQKGTVKESIAITGVGKDEIELASVVTQEMGYGIDLDYLLYAQNRKRFYVGIGYFRSAFSLLMNESSNYRPRLSYIDSEVLKSGAMYTATAASRNDVDIFQINTGFEWSLTDAVHLSLFAHAPIPKTIYLDMHTQGYYDKATKVSGGGYVLDEYVGKSWEQSMVELKSVPIVWNVMFSLYFD